MENRGGKGTGDLTCAAGGEQVQVRCAEQDSGPVATVLARAGHAIGWLYPVRRRLGEACGGCRLGTWEGGGVAV